MRTKIDSRGHLIYIFEALEEDVLSLNAGRLIYTHTQDSPADYYISAGHLFYSLPIMFALITDRTLEDVELVRYLAGLGELNMSNEELSLWLSDLKGAYNHSDLNRVGKAINYVSAHLQAAGCTGTEAAKTDWTAADKRPTAAQLEAYLSKLRTLRSSAPSQSQLPPVPASMGSLDYAGANNIETLLLLINNMLTRIEEQRVYAGQICSGMIWEEFST